MPIIVTDGGAHPPDTWAMTTADQIFLAKPDLVGNRFLLFQKVKLDIAQAIVDHFDLCQKREKDHLRTPQGKARRANLTYEESHDEAGVEADEIIVAIQNITAPSPWNTHWQRPDVVAEARTIIMRNLMSVKDIERQWSGSAGT